MLQVSVVAVVRCCPFFFNLSIGAVSTRFKVAGVNPFFEDQTNGKSPLDVGRLL